MRPDAIKPNSQGKKISKAGDESHLGTPSMISERVEAQYAANTIGMQMTATGLGGAVIPGLLGVLARRFSLEVIPICLVVVFLGLFGFYPLSMK